MTVEEAIKIWQKTKSPYLKRDMEKFIHKHKKGAGNGERTKFAPGRTHSNKRGSKEGRHCFGREQKA